MTYSVPDLNILPQTYPHAVGGVQSSLSAVGCKKLRTASVGSATEAVDFKAHYTEVFNNHEKVQNNLLKQLNAVFGKNIPIDGNRHVNFTDFIKDVCVDSEQANDAYKFYGRQIIEQINQLGDYILKARALLDQTTTNFPQWLIDQLDILDGFSKEINDTFGFRYMYDLNEDIWKLYEDDYTDNTHTQVADGQPSSYQALRDTQVDAYQKAGVFTKKTIEVFNELNLLDRLKYIKLYYDVAEGKTDALFPNNKASGIPTVKEDSKTDVIAAIEPFFMGYLIDRDGPVNAVASYLEIKSAALIEKINIESQKIKALNVYLKFIQRALDVLNAGQSQSVAAESGDDKGKIPSGSQHRISDGAMIGLMYLCSCNMYPLAEASDGTKCLVLEGYVSRGQYLLISADDAGMNCLLGDRGDADNYRGNCYSGTYWDGNRGLHFIRDLSFFDAPTQYHYSTEASGSGHHNDVQKAFGKTFVPSSPIECEKIIPNSVRKYKDFGDAGSIDTPDILSSWQKAFQNKLSFVQTSIDTVDSDIKVFRNKIDTLNTLSNTFRNRTYTAYAKVTSNLRK